MEAKIDKLYPSAPLLENIDLEKRLEKKINDVNSFNNHINNIKEMITFFKDKNNKSKKKYKNYKTLNTIRICRQYRYHRSNINFNNSIAYWYWFNCFAYISWYCLWFINR